MQIAMLAIFLLFINSSLMVPPSEALFFIIGLAFLPDRVGLFAVFLLFGVLANLAGTYLWFVYGRRSRRSAESKLLGFSKPLLFADQAFSQLGFSSIFWLRLVPIVRSIISFPAGRSTISTRQFFTLSFSGILVWGLLWSSLGGFAEHFYRSYSFVIACLCSALVLGVYHQLVRRLFLYVIRKRRN